MKKNNYLLTVFVFLLTGVFAQEQLTLEQAMDIALKNNYDISIVRNNSLVAENNNTLGNAGMLPKVDLLAGTTIANNNTKQEFSSGLIVDKNDVQSQNINAGVFLTWTLFDGLKMFASHKRLQELEAMGALSAKIQIENTLSEIITGYYNVVRQKQLIKGLAENISISEERLKIAEKKMEIGSGAKLDVLQAKVDMNAQTSNLYRQRTTLAKLKMDLNKLLVRNVETEFEVTETIPVEFQLKYEDLRNEIQKNNSDLIFAQRNVNLSHYLLKETQSQLFPRLNLNANYLFSRSENQAGFSLLNQNLGLNLGLTASWTIFNGFITNNQVKNARLQLANADFDYKNTKLQVEHALLSSFKQYQDDQKILTLEEENTGLAKEAVTIALERFRIGASSSIELKEIQKSYDDALTRLADARYNAKVSETLLMKLNGKLIK
ncbi:MAG TPA: TolC family protein [Bacteroidia bacterium]|jgi:outer membrane protein TolC